MRLEEFLDNYSVEFEDGALILKIANGQLLKPIPAEELADVIAEYNIEKVEIRRI